MCKPTMLLFTLDMTSQYSVDEQRVAFNVDTITKSDRGRDQLCMGRSEWNIQELAYPWRRTITRKLQKLEAPQPPELLPFEITAIYPQPRRNLIQILSEFSSTVSEALESALILV